MKYNYYINLNNLTCKRKKNPLFLGKFIDSKFWTSFESGPIRESKWISNIRRTLFYSYLFVKKKSFTYIYDFLIGSFYVVKLTKLLYSTSMIFDLWAMKFIFWKKSSNHFWIKTTETDFSLTYQQFRHSKSCMKNLNK